MNISQQKQNRNVQTKASIIQFWYDKELRKEDVKV